MVAKLVNVAAITMLYGTSRVHRVYKPNYKWGAPQGSRLWLVWPVVAMGLVNKIPIYVTKWFMLRLNKHCIHGGASADMATVLAMRLQLL